MHNATITHSRITVNTATGTKELDIEYDRYLHQFHRAMLLPSNKNHYSIALPVTPYSWGVSIDIGDGQAVVFDEKREIWSVFGGGVLKSPVDTSLLQRSDDLVSLMELLLK